MGLTYSRRAALFFICITLAFLNQTSSSLTSDQPVTIRVHADAVRGPSRPFWSFFGYDEPNYTYAPNGRKLLAELSKLTPAPVSIRTHNLLTSGDGTAALKWGSTNVYSEGPSGKPVYDWTILDRIFDTYQGRGVKPLVEIGFMPEALSTRPAPYRHSWPTGTLWTGWAYPPKDYRRWGNWFTGSHGTSRSVTAATRLARGTGKFGTNRTSATGKDDPKSISSCTILRPTR